MTQHGFLAIWCDMALEDLADYRDWLTKEHIDDRTSCPGFLSGRLFTALDDETSHFILYATQSREVLQSAAYLAMLNNPSPWTRAIMPRFGPFDRAAGEQRLKLGNGYGAFVAVGRIATDHTAPDPEPGALRSSLERFRQIPGVVSVRLMAVDQGATGLPSVEKTLRAGAEGDFRYLLCLEATSAAAARKAAAAMSASLAEIFPGLARHDISTRAMIYGEAPHEAATER